MTKIEELIIGHAFISTATTEPEANSTISLEQAISIRKYLQKTFDEIAMVMKSELDEIKL